MATRVKKTQVYAFAQATADVSGYGHVVLHVYELFGYSGGTLKISCQSGGTCSSGETYAWEHGVSNDHSVLGLYTLKKGYLLMKRIATQLKKLEEERGRVVDFTDFAMRVLMAAGVAVVYVNRTVNARVTGSIKDLPNLAVRKDYDQLTDALRSLEQEIINRTRCD